MRADRFGSYSIVDTFAGMSCLSRLKSMARYIRLWPPPRHHDVRCPPLFLPPELCNDSTSGLCGSDEVSSSNTWTVWNLVPGDVGLNLRIGMSKARSLLRHCPRGPTPAGSPCAPRPARAGLASAPPPAPLPPPRAPPP